MSYTFYVRMFDADGVERFTPTEYININGALFAFNPALGFFKHPKKENELLNDLESKADAAGIECLVTDHKIIKCGPYDKTLFNIAIVKNIGTLRAMCAGLKYAIDAETDADTREKLENIFLTIAAAVNVKNYCAMTGATFKQTAKGYKLNSKVFFKIETLNAHALGIKRETK